MKNKAMAAVAAMVTILCALSACGNQEKVVGSQPELRPGETVETLAIITESTTMQATTAPATEPKVVKLSAESETKPLITEPAEPTTEPAEPTEATEEFVLSSEEVADKMHDFFAEKGYNDAQIAGIVGNAEVESGLEPSRGVPGGGFGLFQLMDCEQRREMLAAFDAHGVGKYATSDYWDFEASDFDTREDFDTFMDIMLDYTMNPNDPTWMNEISCTDSPEEAAEVFLIFYERAVNGSSPIEYYEPYSGLYYQGTSKRREAARRWYEYFSA